MDRVDELIERWRVELPEVLSPTSELVKRIMLLAGDLTEATKRELPRLRLTPAEFDILAGLRRSGEPYRLKANELSRALLLSSGGTSNAVNRLAARGLVQREADPDDGRSTHIRLTGSGKALAEVAVRANSAAHDAVFATLPVDVLHGATDALRDVFTAIETDRPETRQAG